MPSWKPLEMESGQLADGAAQGEGRLADLEAVAEFQAQPVEQERVGDGAELAILRCEERCKWGIGQQCFAEGGGADEGIVGVDGAEAEEGRGGLGGAPAHDFDDFGHLAQAREQCPLLWVGGAVGELGLEIAAQHIARVAKQRRLQRRADRADDGDGRNAERKASEEDGKAAEVAAQIGECDAQPAGEHPHAATLIWAERWPPLIRSWRSARAAILGS